MKTLKVLDETNGELIVSGLSSKELQTLSKQLTPEERMTQMKHCKRRLQELDAMPIVSALVRTKGQLQLWNDFLKV